MGPAEDSLRRLGAALSAAQEAEFQALPTPRAASRLMLEVARRDRRRRVWTRGGGVALTLSLALLLFLLVRPRPLSFEVEGAGPGRVGDWISARVEPLPLSFSDGTVLTLASEARARIVAVERTGARLVLEQGTLSAHVVHRTDTQWTVVAGPFEVRVTGTRFDAVWSPVSDVFELRLQEGSVTVTGPSLGTGRNVQVGEALRIDVREQTAERGAAVVARPSQPEADGVVPPSPAVLPERRSAPQAQESQTMPSPATVQRSPRAETQRQSALKRLRVLAAAGDHAQVVQLAEDHDFSALCREASIGDLMLLADAARLSGAAELARDALLSLRQRFAADPRAATAAFLLGRIFFEQRKDAASAARWFSVYLEEQPQGELAADALSRLAEAKALSGDRAGAREAARRYLRSHPQGPQAERAKLLAD